MSNGCIPASRQRFSASSTQGPNFDLENFGWETGSAKLLKTHMNRVLAKDNRRPAEYQVVSDNCAIDFQRANVAADIRQHFEEPKPVANVYRGLSGLFECLEKFAVCSKFDKRAVGHVNLPLPALLL